MLMGIDGTPSIHINFYEAHIDEVYATYLEVVGDIGNVFWQLTELELDHHWDFVEIEKIKKTYTGYLAEHLGEEILQSGVM